MVYKVANRRTTRTNWADFIFKQSLKALPKTSSQCIMLKVNWTVFLCLVFFPLINYFPEIPPDVYMSDVRIDASLLLLVDGEEKILRCSNSRLFTKGRPGKWTENLKRCGEFLKGWWFAFTVWRVIFYENEPSVGYGGEKDIFIIHNLGRIFSSCLPYFIVLLYGKRELADRTFSRNFFIEIIVRILFCGKVYFYRKMASSGLNCLYWWSC